MIACVLLTAIVAAAPDWKAIELAGSNYWQKPTAENAFRLWALLPNYDSQAGQFLDTPQIGIEPSTDPFRRPGPLFEKLYALLRCIEPGLLVGRSAEVRLAFRLLHIADAAFAEDLSALVGRLATTRPDIFLRELALMRHEFPEERLVDLSRWVDSDLSDRQAIGELRARQKALQKVTAPQYQHLRDACLNQIKRALESIEQERVER